MIEDEKPHLKDQVEAMAKFVRKFSGGSDGACLHALVKYSGTQKSTREIHTTIFKTMADIDFVQGSNYITSMVKAALVAPEQHCRDNQSRLFSSADC